MRKPEQRLWDAMRTHLKRAIWMERIENVAGVGMPDVLLTNGAGLFIFIELKVCTRPARETTRMLGNGGLNVDQINWHKKAAVRDAPCWTLIRDDQNRLYLIHCRHSDVINEMTREELEDNSDAGNWLELEQYLKGLTR